MLRPAAFCLASLVLGFDAAAAPLKVTHLVDSSAGSSWTPQGYIVAMAYLPLSGAETFRGQVVCDLRRFNARTGLAEKEPWGHLAGSSDQGWNQPGPGFTPVWAVPLRIKTRTPFKQVVHVTASCQIDGQQRDPRSHDVYLRPSVQPDLAWVEGPFMDAVACRTQTVPLAEEDTCFRLFHQQPEGLWNSRARELPIDFQCKIYQLKSGKLVQTITRKVPVRQIAPSALLFSVRLDEGRYRVECITDSSGKVPESDESNNLRTGTIEVISQQQLPEYAIAFEKIGAKPYWQHKRAALGFSTKRFMLAMDLRNAGRQAFRGIRVSCKSKGFEFYQAFQVPPNSFPGRGIKPGKFSMALEAEHPERIEPGQYTIRCEAEITIPVLMPDKRIYQEVQITIE